MIIVVLLAVVGAVLAIGYLSQDDGTDNVGGFADPTGTGPEGLLGYRLLIEDFGATTVLDSGLPDESVDVALLASNPFPPFAFEEEISFVESWVPLLEWVEDGGTLITSVDIPTAPQLRVSVNEGDEPATQGVCTIVSLSGVEEIRTLEYAPATVDPGDESCFGDNDGAVVVSRTVGNGQIIRLATMAPLMNRSLDDADNGALAVRLSKSDDSPTVAFFDNAPIFFEPADGVDTTNPGDPAFNGDEVRRDGNGNPIEFSGGELTPLDDDGNPIGQGNQTLWQLIETRVKVMFVGLVIAGFLYVLAVGRRIGSPVTEPLPVELPSSSYVDAVGRLYARTPESRIRSSQLLRNDLRVSLARRVGMSADATALELATAVSSGDGRQELLQLLDGPPPRSDDEFLALSRALVEVRERIEKGGVATLARPDTASLRNERTIRG